MKIDRYSKLPNPNLPNTKDILTKNIIKKTGRKYIIKMNYNENKFGCSKKIKKRIKILSPHIYPEYENHDLYNVLKKISGINRDNIWFSNGSDSILDHIPKIWGSLKKNSNVVIPSLTYGRIEITCNINDLEIRKVNLKNWSISLEETLNYINNHTTIVYIVNPNMPTGTFIEHEKIIWFLNELRNKGYDLLVVIDEAYIEYAKGIEQSYIDDKYIIDNYDNVIITRTFSKLYALASFRIGYCISSKKNIDIFKKTYQYLPVSKYSYQAATAALLDINYYNKIISKTNDEKQFLYDELSRLNFKYQKSYGNYIFVDLSDKKFSNKELEDYLINNHGLLIRSIKDFAIRITIGTREENLILVKGLKEFLNNENK